MLLFGSDFNWWGGLQLGWSCREIDKFRKIGSVEWIGLSCGWDGGMEARER